MCSSDTHHMHREGKGEGGREGERGRGREREKEGGTSYFPRDKLKEIMRDRRTSCLAYLIRKGCVEKLLSVSSIFQTP